MKADCIKCFHYSVLIILSLTKEICGQIPSNPPAVDIHLLHNAVQYGLQEVRSYNRVEAEHRNRGLTVQPQTASYYHGRFSVADPDLTAQARKSATVIVEATRYLQAATNLPLEVLANQVNSNMINEAAGEIVCPEVPECVQTQYRTIDGSCNNLKHPSWGQSMLPTSRLLPPVYDDGINSPRTTGKDGFPLPLSREITSSIAVDRDIPDAVHTHLLMEFGQFLAHDITHSVGSQVPDCCNPLVINEEHLKHVDCFNIEIPENDYFFSQFKQTCMRFLRTTPALSADCKLGPRQQLNVITPYIDGSTVYGSTEEVGNSLRTFVNGTLLSSETSPKVLPPNRPADCNTLEEDEYSCVKAGDQRVNEALVLSLMHQLMFREHNRIVEQLAITNPCWQGNDELLYQEARRILAAKMQHITYNEYLPIMLGEKDMKKYGLTLLDNGYSYDYNEDVDATISNVFAASAFRIGHTQIQGDMDLVNELRRKVGYFSLSLNYNRPLALYHENQVSLLARGLVTETSQSVDNFFTTGVTNHLFQPMNQSYGLDLVSFNIQRGRDHGIPSYVEWRNFCGFPEVTTFDDLYAFMNSEAVDGFRKLYRNVEDIDLFIASNAELINEGDFVPPIVKCVLLPEFKKLKIGDRFWFENGDMPTSFTLWQLQELRKTSLAQIICDNTDIQLMQKKTLFIPKIGNPVVSCTGSDISRINWNAWKVC